MEFTKSIFNDQTVKYFSIDVLEQTGFVKAFYTANNISDWKYGNGQWLNNYKILGKIPQINTDKMCTTNQTHTANVRVMLAQNAGEGILFPTKVLDYDGIITNQKRLLLCSFEADCVPVYFFDPVNKAVGLSHSGWKGTAKLICKNTVEALEKNFNSKPQDLIVVIGPCACKDCYEVGGELKEFFADNFNLEEIFIPKQNGKYNLDLQSAIEHTLLKSGVLKTNIFSVNRCTIESQELCSFRRTKSTVDHMLTAIMLK